MEDLRRSLESLSGEEGALVRAIRRPLTIERLGKQPLGNLVIASVASAFGDYETASRWLGETSSASPGLYCPPPLSRCRVRSRR